MLGIETGILPKTYSNDSENSLTEQSNYHSNIESNPIVDEERLKERTLETDKEKDTSQLTERIGKWTEEEHKKFLEGFELYGKNWDKIHK